MRFTFLILIILYSVIFANGAIPKVSNGEIDISQWNFKKQGSINLNGDWYFKKKHFVSPQSLHEPDSTFSIIKVPGPWPKAPKGYGTYVLKIKGLDNSTLSRPAVELKEIRSSYNLYFVSTTDQTPHLLVSRGGVGASRGESSPYYKRDVVLLPDNCVEGYLVLHVSNYVFNYGGGIKFPITLNSYDELLRSKDLERSIHFMIIGILFFLSFYQMILFLKIRTEKSYFFFSLFCLSMAIFILIINCYIYDLVINPSEVFFIVVYKLLYVSLFGGFPFFFQFLSKLYPHEIPKKHIKVMLIISALFLGFNFLPESLTKSPIIPHSILILYHIFLISSMFYSAYFVGLAVIRKRKDAIYSFCGIVLFLFSIIHDILVAQQLILGNWLGSIGIIGFIITHSIVLGRLFSSAYLDADYLTKHLGKEVERKTKALKLAHEKIAHESEVKTNMFINLAHEIRTPLTIVNNCLFHYRETQPDSQELREITYNIQNLINDVCNFLDAEKISLGKILYSHSTIVDLSSYLKSKVDSLKTYLDTMNINFSSSIEDGALICIDQNALERLINNLIDNAVKYNKHNGFIQVDLINKGNEVVLFIKDTGIGISDEHLHTMFKPYVQVETRKLNNQGLGMGLYIVYEIIQSVGGSINVISEVGKGSTFSVKFPRMEKAEMVNIEKFQTSNIPSVNSPYNEEIYDTYFDVNKQTLFIVEDNISLLRSLREIFSNTYNVFCSKNGKDALEKLKKNKVSVSLFISDIMMDAMGGYEFREKLEKLNDYKSVPFIFLSAKAGEDERAEGLASGAIDYVTKPFSIPLLKAKVRSLIDFSLIKNSLVDIEKFRTIGVLTASISHEILNPLMGIEGPLNVLKRIITDSDLKKDKVARSAIGFMEENIDRISGIINTLKSINQKVDMVEDINVYDLLAPILALLKENYNSSFCVRNEVAYDYVIMSNGSILTQIFSNLLSNAFDAIDEDGVITIRAYNDSRGQIIEVEDTGKGIAPSNLNRIFNFSFSTKPPTKGSGIGLYIVKCLVEKIGAEISVQSELGYGTTFQLIFK